jgi:superfamily II DNA/RNA helicase
MMMVLQLNSKTLLMMLLYSIEMVLLLLLILLFSSPLHNTLPTYSSPSQKQRFKALESLGKNQNGKNGRYGILVATDVAARGIDVENVSAVVHYDMPRSVDTFIHRSGRTAVS